LLAVLCIASITPADTITQGPQSYTADTDWGFDHHYTFNQFNPVLGTLTGVEIDVNGTLVTSGDYTYSGGGPANVHVSVTGNLDYTLPDLGAISSGSLTLVNRNDLAVPSGTNQLFSGSKSFNVAASTFSSFAPFLGTGTFDVLGKATAMYDDYAASNLVGGADTYGMVDVKVYYKYTPASAAVPTPGAASAGLGLFGLCGLSHLYFAWKRSR
jgi:hypothetical protein